MGDLRAKWLKSWGLSDYAIFPQISSFLSIKNNKKFQLHCLSKYLTRVRKILPPPSIHTLLLWVGALKSSHLHARGVWTSSWEGGWIAGQSLASEFDFLSSPFLLGQGAGWSHGSTTDPKTRWNGDVCYAQVTGSTQQASQGYVRRSRQSAGRGCAHGREREDLGNVPLWGSVGRALQGSQARVGLVSSNQKSRMF